MNDIKTQFEKWLEKEKYAKKTSDDYVKRISRICNKFFGSNNHEGWQRLADNIFSVLSCYQECNNNQYYIRKDNILEIQSHFQTLLNYVTPIQEIGIFYPTIKLDLVYDDNEISILKTNLFEITDLINAYIFLLENLDSSEKIPDLDSLAGHYAISLETGKINKQQLYHFFEKIVCTLQQSSNSSDLVLHIVYDEKDNLKNKHALTRFYDFLKINDYPTLGHPKFDLTYENFDEILLLIRRFHSNLVEFRIAEEQTGISPRKIKADPIRNKKLYPYEVAEILMCDLRTLRKLKKDKILIPSGGVKARIYDEDKINKYLDDNHKRLEKPYPGVKYDISFNDDKEYKEVWCDEKTAAKKLHCDRHTITKYTRKKLLTHTIYAPRNPKYYIPELTKLSKLLKHHKSKGITYLRKLQQQL